MTVLIDRAPQVMMLALDGQHHLIEMPFVSALRLAPAQRTGIPLAELQRPLTDRLVRDGDAATGHQFFYVAKAQRKSEVEPHYVTDDLGRITEAAIEMDFGIPQFYKICPPAVS